MNEKLLRENEVAALLSCAPQTLRAKRSVALQGGTLEGPMFIRLGRSIRYRESDVMAYLDECARKTAEACGLK